MKRSEKAFKNAGALGMLVRDVYKGLNKMFLIVAAFISDVPGYIDEAPVHNAYTSYLHTEAHHSIERLELSKG